MKAKHIISLSGCFLLLSVLSSCFNDRVKGNGHLSTEDREATPFSRISNIGSFEVYLTTAEEYSISVKAESNLFPYIETEVVGDELVIQPTDHTNLRPSRSIEIYLTAPSMASLSLDGSGYIEADTLQAEAVTVDLVGSGTITTGIKAESLESHLVGSGKIKLKGSCGESALSLIGSGNFRAFPLACDSCTAYISGSGDMEIQVATRLDAIIEGSGKIYYKGNPITNSKVEGSGAIVHVAN